MKKTAKFLSILLIGLLLTATVTCKSVEEGGILDIPPLKDQFSDYFMIGNIMNPGDIGKGVISNKMLTHHYNVLTHENDMKPDKTNSTRNSYGSSTATSMTDAAIASGMKVVGHTLLWHSQIPSWQQGMANASKDEALKAMQEFITGVVSKYQGKIYSWDVLNEAFPDGNLGSDWKTSMRRWNPWFASIGSDFVYYGFLAARLADPGAILYYNDYNTDMAAKARLIRDMVVDVNNRYLASGDKPAGEDPNRLLIEGIGMQEHHNTGVSANNVKATLRMFDEMKFEGSDKKIIISVSELDVLSQNWQEFDSGQSVTKEGQAAQARLYGEYFKVYLEYHEIIERVSFWGVTDDQSWRSKGLPLIFNARGEPKDAYHSIIKALEDYKAGN